MTLCLLRMCSSTVRLLNQLCNAMVHQSCMGLSAIPEKDVGWFCDLCKHVLFQRSTVHENEVQAISFFLDVKNGQKQIDFLSLGPNVGQSDVSPLTLSNFGLFNFAANDKEGSPNFTSGTNLTSFPNDTECDLSVVRDVLLQYHRHKCQACGQGGSPMIPRKNSKSLWMHLSCVYWIDGLTFCKTIRQYSQTPRAKTPQGLKCEVCHSCTGIVAPCFESKCGKYVHPECARVSEYEMVLPSELYANVSSHILFCKAHSRSKIYRRIVQTRPLYSKREKGVMKQFQTFQDFKLRREGLARGNFLDRFPLSRKIVLTLTESKCDNAQGYRLSRIQIE